MGKKSTTPPDPVKTAQAQSDANIQAAIVQKQLNQNNLVSPFGSINFSGGPFDTTQTITLSPQEQQKLDLSNQLSIGLGNTGLDLLGTLPTGPIDLSGLPGRVGSVPAPTLQTSFDQPFDIQQNLDPTATSIQGGVDLSGAPTLPGQGDFGAERRRIENTIFGAQEGRINQQFNTERERIRQQLADQGIPVGSPAYNDVLRQFEQNKTDALLQASSFATQFAGAEQGRLFNQGLSSRDQIVNELFGQGGFRNTAQGQEFGQNLQGGFFTNQASAQDLNRITSLAGLGNSALAGQFGLNQASGDFTNASRTAGVNEALALRNQPFNELASLLAGTQPNANQLQPQQQIASGIAPPPIADLIMNDFNIRQAQSASSLGALSSLASTGLTLLASGEGFKDVMLELDGGDTNAGLFQKSVFEGFKLLPLYVWRYNKNAPFPFNKDKVPHVGPMAEQFNGLFSPKAKPFDHINSVDFFGVISTVIKTLIERMERIEIKVGAPAW